MTAIDESEIYTKDILGRLRSSLEGHLADDATRILREDTCVYVVGSGGRGEMSQSSDADLFVARVGRAASEVDALLVQQAIARALFDCGLQDPSQGGGFLKMHTAGDLCERMGTPEDDATNTFTARMLLVLESACLLNEAAYQKVLASVLSAYWKNPGHEADYLPFVLVNDIVRYWRILLLNYVAKNAEKERELNATDARAEWKLRSYKLRFSRCLTCFSMLGALLSATDAAAVTQDHVRAIIRQTPIERLRGLAAKDGAADHVTRLLELYESFLRTTAQPKSALLQQMAEGDFASARIREGREFGDEMFDLLEVLGRTGRARELFRHMVV